MTSVLIGNVNPGTVHSDYMVAILNFMQYDRENRAIFKGYLPWRASYLLDIYRNMVVESFLTDTDFEWLWFIDSDIEIEPTTLYTLIDAADPTTVPVISAIYPMAGKNGNAHPSLWHWGEENGRKQFIPYDVIPDPNPAGLVQADGVGAGCLLIHRSFLQAMRTIYPPSKPWFDMGTFEGIPCGEDFTFCHRVAQMGYTIYAHPSALVNHFKEFKLTLKDTSNAASS